MQRIPAIKAVMTPFPWSIGEGEPVERAAALMVEHGIRHLPVVRGEEVVGVIGEREVEIVRRAGSGWGAGESDGRGGDGGEGTEGRTDGVTVGAVMTDRACVVELDEPLDNVLLRMAEQRHDCAVVLRQGRLAGIFTGTDACRRFAGLLRDGRPVPGDDAA